MIRTNLSLVRKNITKTYANIDIASRMARDEMSMAFTQLAKKEIQGRRKPGEKAVAGLPPKNRTGNLRRSIRAEKYRKGFASYTALVGPTIVYGRSVELGGNYAPQSWEGTTAMRGFPYMAPAFKKFKVVAPNIVAKHLKAAGKI